MKIISIVAFIVFLLIGCAVDQPISIQEKLEIPSQEYFINPNKDTLIKGEQGTMIFIEKGSLYRYSGEPIGDSIVISLKELYKTSDILMSNVTMRSKEKVLETGGMIELRAYAEGEELGLHHGKSLIVHFPRKKSNDSMRLFYGRETNPHYDQEIEEGYSSGIVDKNVLEWDLEESSVPEIINKIVAWYIKYEGLDTSNLLLDNGNPYWDTIKQVYNFRPKEIEYFLNKTTNVNYLLDKKGDLHFKNIEGSIISKKMKKRLKKATQLFPKCKPYSIAGKPIDMDGHFQIWSEVIPPNYMNNQGYLDQIERKLSPDSNNSSISIMELQYYIFDSKQLGWMNCDQFINPNPIQEDFIVEVPKSDNIFVKIIFRNYKTVMVGNEEKGAFVFENLPINEPIKIVVIDDEDGKPLLEIKNTKTSKEPFKINELKPVNLEELKKKLAELN